MSNEYTPSMDEVRDAFAGKGTGYGNEPHYERQAAEFDRWLADHDVQVRADQAERDAMIAKRVKGGHFPQSSGWVAGERIETVIRGQSFTGTEKN